MTYDTTIIIQYSHEATIIGAVGFVVVLAIMLIETLVEWFRDRKRDDKNTGGRA